MKKNNFRIDKLRKKLEKNENWLRNFVDKLKNDEKYWNDFDDFKCSEHFVGYKTSKINKKIYERNMDLVDRRFKLAGEICQRIYKKDLSELW